MKQIKALSLLLLMCTLTYAQNLTVECTSLNLEPDTHLPLRITFSEPMIPFGYAKDSVPKGLSIVPPVSGKWSWSSQNTLQFIPDAPWHSGYQYQITVPKETTSKISGKSLKRTFIQNIISKPFTGRISSNSTLLTTIDSVSISFSQPVHPDSLRKHLSGANSLDLTESKWMYYHIRRKTGWPQGKRITLTIDAELKPIDGNMHLDSALSISFVASDSLICLGLFRNDVKVSLSDSLFLEDNYSLRFNRPLHREAISDYLTVNGKPFDYWLPNDNQIDLKNIFRSTTTCTLSFAAGMPSADSAFLFNDMHFILNGAYNRIDQSLPSFSIDDVEVTYGSNDSLPVMKLSTKALIPLTPSMQFKFSFNKSINTDNEVCTGLIYCRTQEGIDTIPNNLLHFNRPNLPPNTACTLIVKAGYRLAGYQLKKDFNIPFKTGKYRYPGTCRSVISRWNNYRFWQHTPNYLLLPESPSVPLEVYGIPKLTTALRNIPSSESLQSGDSSKSFKHQWIYDTIQYKNTETDFYTYTPVPLTPVLSGRQRGSAELLYSVNDSTFDTIGQFNVTDLGLQLLRGRLVTAATVTSLTSKQPVAGAKVTFYEDDLQITATGLTDSSGLFSIPEALQAKYVSVVEPEDTLVFKLQKGYKLNETINKGIIFIDRPLYRPGDTIFFKGIFRQLKDHWTPVTNDSVVVNIAWEGATPFVDTVQLKDCGSFSGKTVVPDNATQKGYSVIARMFHQSDAVADADFSITEFRPAELSARARIKDGLVRGDSIFFPVSAKWLHGGMAGGCPVSLTWNITRNVFRGPHEFTWKNDMKRITIISNTGSANLDSNGLLTISRGRLPDDSGATYTLSAVFSGSPQQSVKAGNRIQIPGNHHVQIGFAFSQDTYNDSSILLIKSIFENGKVAKNIPLNITLYQHKDIKKMIKNRCGLPGIIHVTMKVELPSMHITTDTNGIVEVFTKKFPASRYTVTAEISGKPEVDTFSYKFTIEKPFSNKRYSKNYEEERDVIKPVFTISETNKCIHKPGDTIGIRLQSSLDSCAVAIAVRRENLYEYRRLKMTSRDTIVTFAIKDNYIPTVYFEASFFPPLWRNEGGLTFNQPPGVYTASTKITVTDQSRRIPLQIHTYKKSYSPGDSVTVTIDIPDKFPSAKALVMVVDEGILRLTNAVPPQIINVFTIDTNHTSSFKTDYSFSRFHGPFNYDSANALKHHPQWYKRKGVAGLGYGAGYGSGFGGFGGSDDVIDLYDILMDGKDGGFRNPPRSCAYFNPSVTFDSTGKAVCSFMLPGNLTRWRITAIVDDTTSFGSDTLSFESNKPLMIRPQIPRFLRAGDTASALYIVENRTKKPLQIKSGTIFTNDTTIDSFTLKNDASHSCYFPLIGRKNGTDSLVFLSRSDTFSDGISINFPVISEHLREIQSIGGSTVDSITIPLILPEKSDINTCTLGLSLSTTRMQNLREGARYLFEYPYGCLEQQSSKILPLLLLGDFAKRFELPMLKNMDEKQVIQTYLDHIKDFQNESDGGLTYWPSDYACSYPWLTAYVLEVMIEANESGFSIDKGVYTRALDYLKHISSKNRTEKIDYIIDSYTLLILARSGKPDHIAMTKLFKDRDKLPVTAKINLLKSMYIAGKDKRAVRILQKILRQGLIEKDRLAYFSPVESHDLSYCHESPVRQTALCLEALLETGSRSRFDEPMIRWLTAQRQSGRWRTTQENMAVFRAFAAYTNIYEHDEPKLNAAITLGGSDWFTTALHGREGTGTRKEQLLDSIPDKETSVHINRTGSGRLYYDLSLTKELSGIVSAASSGLAITRNIKYLQPKESKYFELSTGVCITVELIVRCDQDITFAVVEDPIPAGCEAVNPELRSGEQYMTQKIRDCEGPANPTHREFRDSRVLFFFNEMPAGEYRIRYLLKPVTEGRFIWPAPHAEAMYYPEIFGRGEDIVARIHK